MSHLSVRKLPDDVEASLEEEARRRGKTKSELVIRALRRLFNLDDGEERRRRLRRFFGKMSHEEYQRIMGSIEDLSSIDEELWK